MILKSTIKKIIGFSILLLILVLSYYFFVINILNNGNEIYTISQSIKEQKAKESQLVSIQQNLSKSKTGINNLQNFVLVSGGEVGFIKTIEGLAVSSNVKAQIKTAKIEPVTGKETVVVENFKVGLDAIGKWSDVIYFLTLIENLPYKIQIVSVSLDKFSDNAVTTSKISQWLLSIEFSVVKFK